LKKKVIKLSLPGNETTTVEETASDDGAVASSTGDVITTLSVPVTTVPIPSPSTQVASLPVLNTSIVISVPNPVAIEITSTSSVSPMVTPVAPNKTAELLKGIHALEGKCNLNGRIFIITIFLISHC